jgi:hypothetical protein
VLDPDDFASPAEQPEPPPRDLIREAVWSGIMHLPDDVCIQTSSHFGSVVEALHDLWGASFELLDNIPEKCPTWFGVLNSADEFRASLFEMIHGFYRPSAGTLRACLDILLIAACCELRGDHPSVQAHVVNPDAQSLRFGNACDLLSGVPVVEQLDTWLRATTGDNLFGQRNRNNEGGLVRRLYGALSRYSHSDVGSGSGDIWRSNGPVFVGPALRETALHYLQVYFVMCLLTNLAHPQVSFPRLCSDKMWRSDWLDGQLVIDAVYPRVFPAA